jgi:hypothetical protein
MFWIGFAIAAIGALCCIMVFKDINGDGEYWILPMFLCFVIGIGLMGSSVSDENTSNTNITQPTQSNQEINDINHYNFCPNCGYKFCETKEN